MVQYELIREMPLKDLLVYYDALRSICDVYEAKLRPLFNATSPMDKIKWIELNNELQHTKLYFDAVLDAMKYQSFHGLDEYKPKKKEKVTASIANVFSTETPKKRGRKKKE